MGNHLAKMARGSLAALVVLSLAMNSLRAEPIYTVTDQGVVPDSVLDEGHSPMDVLTQRRLTIDDKGVIQAKNWDLPSDYAGPLPENMTKGGNPPSAVATSRAGDNVAGWGFDQNHGWTGFADIDGYATSVGKLQGAHWSQALGINREGQVVGMSGGDRPQAFLYTRDQGIKPIGPAGTPSAAYAINDSGQVVGEMATPAGSNPAQASVSGSSTASTATTGTSAPTSPTGASSATPPNTASQVMAPLPPTTSPSATNSASQVQVTPGSGSAPGASQVPTTSPSTASTQTAASNSSPATTSQATGAGNPGVATQVMAQSASGSTSATTSTSPSTGSTSTGTSNAGHTASGTSGGGGQTPSTLSTSTSAPSSATSAVTTTSPSATTGSGGAASSPSSGTTGASATPTLASSGPTDSTTLAATTSTTAPQPGATTPASTTSTTTTGTSTTDAASAATSAATSTPTQTRAFTSFGTGPMLDLNRMIDYSLGLNLTRAMDINMYGQIAAFGVDPEGKTHSLLLTPNTTIDEATLAAAAGQAGQAELSSARLTSSPLAVPEPSLVMFSLLVGAALVVRSAPRRLASSWSRLSR